MKNNSGVSIIIFVPKQVILVNRLFTTFFEYNTHHPVEFIIIDQGGGGETVEEALERYATRVFIRRIKGSRELSLDAVNQCIFQRTRYPYLLFLRDDGMFSADGLVAAVEGLADPLVNTVSNLWDGGPENRLLGQNPESLRVGITGDFLFCRKADFAFIGGFSREYPLILQEDNPFHVLKTRLDGINVCHKDCSVQCEKSLDNLHVLFVLPQPLDSNCGYHVERLAAGLQSLGAQCIAAVPQRDTPHRMAGTPLSGDARQTILSAYTYADMQNKGIVFSDGRKPDIIHAWTPREGVRRFVTSLTAENSCPVVIHLEDNEEYLTEIAVGRPFAEIEMLSEKELDNIVPNNRYHPIHGRKWLKQAQGLTMIIETLEKFNFGCIPSLTILPPVDERLFYPRPMNWELRKKLHIPVDHRVLVYTGNVHAGNREEVLTLYRAVQLLNQQGCLTTLIRTGVNARALTDGDDSWVKHFEKSLGWVNREELPDVMAAADLFIQPGKPGPFNDYRIPCKLPEYFAMGRPVILPRTNLGLKAVQGLDIHVLDSSDAEGISNAVLQVINEKRPSIKTEYSGNDHPPDNKYPRHPACSDLEQFYRMIIQQDRHTGVFRNVRCRDTDITGLSKEFREEFVKPETDGRASSMQPCPSRSNQRYGRIAFIDHFYHRKTRSSWFFLQYLAQFFDIDIYWDYSYRGDRQPDGEFIRKQGYDFIIVWQCVHSFETMKALSPERLIGIPMYDNSGTKPADMFLTDMEYLSFSSHMHETLLQYGCRSMHIQYFPDPIKFADSQRDFSNLRGFFWQRTPAITWETIRQLIDATPFASLHVHMALDAEHLQVPGFPKSWRGIPITQSAWFENQSEYYRIIQSANIFFVPRPTEGIGLSFLEAMALGMCVVSPDCPTMNEYITHHVNGLLYDRNCPAPLDFSNAGMLGYNARRTIEAGRLAWLDQMIGLCADWTGLDKQQVDFMRYISGQKNNSDSILSTHVREISMS